MKAVVYSRYGTPDVLELKEVNKPIPKDNEVLIKVCAVAINDWDWALLTGTPSIYRLMSGIQKPKKEILGSDIAGRIEAVGKNVKKFKPGDEVFGDLSDSWGGFAEYVCADEKALAIKPESMTFEEAAAIPQAGMLTVQGLIDKGQIRSGIKLLVNGAGGGVGTFAIQIAKLFGIEATGVDSTEKLNMMRTLGYDHVIDYTKEDFTQSERKYDLILDVKTNRSVLKYSRVLKTNGIYVTVGGSPSRLFQILVIGPLISRITKKHFQIVALKPNKDLEYMKDLFEKGNLNPVIDGHYTLNETADAFRYYGAGHAKGKVVISVDDD